MNEAVRCPICHLRIPPYGMTRLMWGNLVLHLSRGTANEGYCQGHAPQVVPQRRQAVPQVFYDAWKDEVRE